MEQPTIYTVLAVLRSFSNQVTVNSLADQLHISYSTLARCKNGKWPPSITFDTLRQAFDTYKGLYFDGDEGRAAAAIVDKMRSLGYATDGLEAAFAQGGYTRLVDELLVQASTSQGEGAQSDKAQAATFLPAKPQATAAVPCVQRLAATPQPASMQTDAVPDAKTDAVVHEAIAFIPLAAIVVLGLFQVPLGNLLSWIGNHYTAFAGISLALAVLPAAAGLCIDAPLAWRRFRKAQPEAAFSWMAFMRVAKFGALDGVQPGAGRFDASRGHLAFAVLSNVAGAMCYLSLFAFLHTLPGLASYVESHAWTEAFKASAAVAFAIAYHHTRTLANLPRPKEQVAGYNPDNYRFDRVHAWANIVHLVWTITLSCIATLCLLGYGIEHAGQAAFPLALLWPVVQVALFLAYANFSPFAMQAKAPSIGEFAPGMAIVAASMAAFTLACFRFTWTSALACLAYGAMMAAAFAWKRASAGEGYAQWARLGKASRAYSFGMAAIILAMLAVDLLR